MSTDQVAELQGEPRRMEARYYSQAEWDAVQCHLCPHQCAIAPSRAGNCGMRVNRHGRLYTEVYNRVGHLQTARSSQLPLFHLHPSKPWLQVGLKGCNLRCPFCETYRWSQLGAGRTVPITVDQLVAHALTADVVGISFGVTEPLVGHEFVLDVFAAARAAGLRTHLATSGEWSEEPFEEILPHVDAITFGFKGFNSEWLMQTCGGHLEVAMSTMTTAVARDTHVEVAYLLVDTRPGWREELINYCDWLEELPRHIPTTLVRLNPAFIWKEPPTRPASLVEAMKYLRKRVSFVYSQGTGDVPGDTRCPSCGRVMIRRIQDETLVDTGCSEGLCPACGAELPFVI